MRQSIIILLIATGCVNGTVEESVNDLTLLEIGQRLNGHWRLKETETENGTIDENIDADKFEYYEFEGLKGMKEEMTDNHDGTFLMPTCQPGCELKEEENKRIIKYIGLGGSCELEIVKLSEDELILSGSGTKWTYERTTIKEW
jgi:hypothetical protein